MKRGFRGPAAYKMKQKLYENAYLYRMSTCDTCNFLSCFIVLLYEIEMSVLTWEDRPHCLQQASGAFRGPHFL